MSSYENPVVDKLIRWGGIALIVSGVCVAAAYLLHPPEAPPETVASGMWIFIHGTFMVSLLGGVFGMIALMIPYIRGGGGMSGVTGFAMGLSGFVPMLVVKVGAVIFGAGLALLGKGLLETASA